MKRCYNFKSLFVGCNLLVIFALAGCQSTPKQAAESEYIPELANLPPLALKFAETPQKRAYLLDHQRALNKRNLYLTIGGNLDFIQGKCPIDVVAHRGQVDQPENSPNAFTYAAFSNFDGAETDVMITRDGYWVVMHDPETGRTVARADGKRYRVSKMKGKDWATLKLRDKNGDLTHQRAPFVDDVLKAWRDSAGLMQPINIELKSDASVTEMYHLDQMVRSYLAPSQYFYSSMNMDALVKMREVNPYIYLGYAWDADSESIAILKRDMRKAAASDASYRAHRYDIERAMGYESRYRSRQASKKYSAVTVRQKLGTNSGLHVDIRNFVRHPSIYQRAKAAGLKRVATYTINGTDYHQQQLVALKRMGRQLPDEAIMDTSKYQICSQLAPSLIKDAPKQSDSIYNPGKLVDKLPNDADFSRLVDQVDYVLSGSYITITGKIKRLHAARTHSKLKAKVKPAAIKHPSAPVVAADETFDVLLAPVEITLPVKQ